MQQAYRVLRVVAAAQTIRMVLMLRPNEIILSELYTACTTLNSESSRGIKAVVLDFQPAHETLTGEQALRLGLINWSVPLEQINSEMERVLDMLREQSAIALRLVKASVHQKASQPLTSGKEQAATRLAALDRVNEFYLNTVMQTADANEGLHAFLEKRKPQWQNR